ncbi:hypothetical protein EDD37DRAFT_60007 [Exophiala viscosa]|uniref:Uncharacterized protein n=1 Tax=Exophiala viscosa TaxID=2486360 RepID=A0AAN6E2R7_9EURO|nr:hypothetical protein EDD36DRAFT_484515 [Exophiala viscosa]KAI1629611.1 hypothetical protein EDD37DRAFT_60007 [Exophiala viscosa]
MTTLLAHTGVPLWVYIVLIAVGSTVLLLTIAALSRWWFVRRKASQKRDYDGLTGATRHVTLRRGRVVPTSQHLSLTGSRFGMRQFGMLADNDSTHTGRRSPFEWWNTIITERSQSRQDQMSQLETGSLTPRSVYGFTRQELGPTTPTQTPEKDQDATARTWEVTPPSISPSPSPSSQKTVNFSRAFVPRVPSSPVAQRSQFTLSRISERSPHQSMISPAAADRPERLSCHDSPRENTTVADQQQQILFSPQSSPRPTIPTSNIQFTAMSPTFRSHRPSPLSLDPHPAQQSSKFSASIITIQPYSHTPSPTTLRPHTADASLYKGGVSDMRPYDVPVPDLAVPKPVRHASISPELQQYTQPNLYRQPSKSQPDLSHRMSTVSVSEFGSGGSFPSPRKSTSTIGSSGIVYESQFLDWSINSDLQKLSFSLDRPAVQQPQDRVHEGEQENLMGIITVPGKNRTKVLRKKSLGRQRLVTSVTG